jgi:hypothetical protein
MTSNVYQFELSLAEVEATRAALKLCLLSVDETFGKKKSKAEKQMETILLAGMLMSRYTEAIGLVAKLDMVLSPNTLGEYR